MKILLVPPDFEIIFGTLSKWSISNFSLLLPSFSILKVIAKSKERATIITIGIVGRAITVEMEIKERAISIQGAIEKSQI